MHRHYLVGMYIHLEGPVVQPLPPGHRIVTPLIRGFNVALYLTLVTHTTVQSSCPRGGQMGSMGR